MDPLEFKEIRDANDWKWYKLSVDVLYKVSFDHGKDPIEYPVKVKSEHDEDYNGRDYIQHTFVYRQRVECDSCHSVKIVWPEG